MSQDYMADGAGFFQSFSAKKIESVNNPAVKYIARLCKSSKARRKENVFVAEGPRMVFETPSHLLRQVYVTEVFLKGLVLEKQETLLSDVRQVNIVSDSVMKAMSDTMTPSGILAVVEMPHYEMADLLHCGVSGRLGADREAKGWEGSAPLFLVLETIQDPGNLGTMFRTAEGAGCTGILMSRDTVDVFSPKVVRSTMGSLYRMPFVICEDLMEAVAFLQAEGVKVYAAHLSESRRYDEPDYTAPSAFCIGNEGSGLSDRLAEACDERIHIPMQGQVESLNAAMSAGILLFEAARKRQRA